MCGVWCDAGAPSFIFEFRCGTITRSEEKNIAVDDVFISLYDRLHVCMCVCVCVLTCNCDCMVRSINSMMFGCFIIQYFPTNRIA